MILTKLISIHALREEGDVNDPIVTAYWQISIHALREEGDFTTNAIKADQYIFLSTPSARRATAASWSRYCVLTISIHALREEGDWASCP